MIASAAFQMTSIFHHHFMVNVVFIKMTLFFMVIMSVIIVMLITVVVIVFAVTVFSSPRPGEMIVILFLSRQFIIHVLKSIDVDQGRNQRDHRKHADCQRIDVITDRQLEVIAKLAKHVVFTGNRIKVSMLTSQQGV